MASADPKQLLRDVFGFDDYRSGQKAVMSALWKHKAALAVFPTGGGKSLCYQLPALMFEGVTVVVSPLIALMKDQIDFLKSRGVAAERLDSSLSFEESRSVTDRMRDGSLKLLYIAPERFNNERFLSQLKQTKVALFAVDEAHCISEWGHNFRPDYLKLAEAARDIQAERILALTATATPSVVEDICGAFGIPEAAAVVTGFYRHNLTMLTTPVSIEERDDVLVSRLRERTPGPSIVYVTLQRTAESIAARLCDEGLPARPYHAGMDDENRTAVQEWWMASGDGIVVATIAFGMGIDKANVRYVYHYNLPKSLESYSQEIGRAGRDDQPATVEMFACLADVPVLENFAFGDTPTETALAALVQRATTAGEAFDLNLTELSAEFDIRQLVLRTALTYLELSGVLKQGTPFYAGYAAKPLVPLSQIYAQFPGEPGRFLKQIFDAAPKAGRAVWYRMNPDEIAAALGAERRRIIRALEVLEERELITLTAADVRNRFTRVQTEPDVAALTEELTKRFHKREHQEILRIQAVLRLVRQPNCQTIALVGYFGEERTGPCGHCTFCLTKQAQTLPPAPVLEPLPAGLNLDELEAIGSENPDALGDARQTARFLCGLSSPATLRAKLTRHPLFGALSERRFMDVLAWLEGRALRS